MLVFLLPLNENITRTLPNVLLKSNTVGKAAEQFFWVFFYLSCCLWNNSSKGGLVVECFISLPLVSQCWPGTEFQLPSSSSSRESLLARVEFGKEERSISLLGWKPKSKHPTQRFPNTSTVLLVGSWDKKEIFGVGEKRDSRKRDILFCISVFSCSLLEELSFHHADFRI